MTSQRPDRRRTLERRTFPERRLGHDRRRFRRRVRPEPVPVERRLLADRRHAERRTGMGRRSQQDRRDVLWVG